MGESSAVPIEPGTGPPRRIKVEADRICGQAGRVTRTWHRDCRLATAGDCRAQFETGRRRDTIFRARRRTFLGQLLQMHWSASHDPSGSVRISPPCRPAYRRSSMSYMNCARRCG